MRTAYLFFVVLTACGGKVVFVEDGAEGGNAGTGANGSGPSTNSSTGTGTVQTPCEQACSQHPECFENGTGDCTGQCLGMYPDTCHAEVDALILCFLANVGPSCRLSGECSSEQAAVDDCLDQGQCQNRECEVGDWFCRCSGTCAGVDLEENCYLVRSPGPGDDPPVQVTCECLSDGIFIGSCGDVELHCDLSAGCCQDVLLDHRG